MCIRKKWSQSKQENDLRCKEGPFRDYLSLSNGPCILCYFQLLNTLRYLLFLNVVNFIYENASSFYVRISDFTFRGDVFFLRSWACVQTAHIGKCGVPEKIILRPVSVHVGILFFFGFLDCLPFAKKLFLCICWLSQSRAVYFQIVAIIIDKACPGDG